ncbi:hypothetical protein BJ878DRAFT_315913 [Calycina marina]|uniref:Uncharacterized protein n=1 Tax=Calycina marina TaxID=1763456 RepID=A0A9P8CI20_9HELO|nr:hypothetical protein BJ878DRAFT_315913 [Calycina marina]
MVQYYSILGRQIGSHHLAMSVLGLLTTLTVVSTGGSKVQKSQGPPLNAKSPDEESFIKDFLKQAEGGKESIADQVKKTVKDH